MTPKCEAKLSRVKINWKVSHWKVSCWLAWKQTLLNYSKLQIINMPVITTDPNMHNLLPFSFVRAQNLGTKSTSASMIYLTYTPHSWKQHIICQPRPEVTQAFLITWEDPSTMIDSLREHVATLLPHYHLQTELAMWQTRSHKLATIRLSYQSHNQKRLHLNISKCTNKKGYSWFKLIIC